MNAAEFENKFRKLYLPLGMYALRIVDNCEDAEDVVEDSFIKAWQLINDGFEPENFKAFMYKSVHNNCISFLRGKKQTFAEEDIPDIAEEDIDTSERDALIWNTIDSLPDKCRIIFLMSKRDGMSNQEIADELGISLQTVKNQISKALSRLRESLSGGYKPFFLPFL